MEDRRTQWIEWTRTRLRPQERDDLLTALTSEQKAHLLEHDYVWVEGIGVLWNSADGDLRRRRFTHGTHFQTHRGEFYIGSEGSVRELLRAEATGAGREIKVRPLHARILGGIQEKGKTKGGLSIPETAKEKLLEGELNGAATETEMKETPSASATGN